MNRRRSLLILTHSSWMKSGSNGRDRRGKSIPDCLKNGPLDSGVKGTFVLRTFPTLSGESCVRRLGLLVLNSQW